MSDLDSGRAAARADVCRLLAALYYEPGPEFLEENVFDSLRTAAVQVDASLAELSATLGAAFQSVPLLDLQVDHTRLFLNPSGPLAAPYESFWLGRRDPALAGKAMEAVIASYSAAGFRTADEFKDLPDHIAAELEFLYALIFREAVGNAQGDAQAQAAARELQRAFLENHLGQWAESFLSAQRAEAETLFFRTLADLADRFLKLERASA
jgi:TorA maturation chaperone TorD